MVSSGSTRVTIVVAVALFSLVASACSRRSQEAGTEDATSSGSVTFPLTASANGHTYRLLNLSIYVNGPTFVFLESTNDPDETQLSATLAAGNYSLQVENYTVERDDGTGTFRQVSAQLLTTSAAFTIFSGTTRTVTLQFQTDGVIVTAGSGRLNAKVQVNEVAPACVALGSCCGSGKWCPPSDLTGAQPGCVLAGAKGLGAPCSSPTDCVANASCFDLGSGAVCTALCSSSNLGQACASGGSCQAAGLTYGLCTSNDGGIDGGIGSSDGGGGSGGDGGGVGVVVSPACEECTTDNCFPQTDGCDLIVDASDHQLCESAYDCFVAPTHPGTLVPGGCTTQGDPLECWCGTNPTTCVTSNLPPTQANGPCLDAVFAAAKTTDAATIKLRFIDPSFPLGRAVNLVSCQGSFCSDECDLR